MSKKESNPRPEGIRRPPAPKGPPPAPITYNMLKDLQEKLEFGDSKN